jgi:hypothetical protein
MVPGWLGVGLTVTVNVDEVELPHALTATTLIVPLFTPAVVLMLLVVLEPVQPPGSVHV